MEKKIIWGCKWEQLKTPMSQFDAVLGVMATAAKGDFIIDGDEKTIYLVLA